MAGIGANIFAGLGVGSPASPTVANTTPTYGPPASSNGVGPLSPRHGFGMGLWGAALGLAALVVIRWSLPR
jgi:hypothetical protein